jgi:hypothetical protein
MTAGQFCSTPREALQPRAFSDRVIVIGFRPITYLFLRLTLGAP